MDRIVKNEIKLECMSLGENVALVRIAIAALAAQLEVTLNDLEEIKVATSEAISNSIIHGYGNKPDGIVTVVGRLYDDCIEIEVIDTGVGIADVKQAMQPAYTTDPERMGLGFVFMQSFMDHVQVESQIGAGTKVRLRKTVSSRAKSQAVS